MKFQDYSDAEFKEALMATLNLKKEWMDSVNRREKELGLPPTDLLEPELQEIISMPRAGRIDSEDLNGEQARIDYYKEKYSL